METTMDLDTLFATLTNEQLDCLIIGIGELPNLPKESLLEETYRTLQGIRDWRLDYTSILDR